MAIVVYSKEKMQNKSNRNRVRAGRTKQEVILGD
jgi:hypothetical protein